MSLIEHLRSKVQHHLEIVYHDVDLKYSLVEFTNKLLETMRLDSESSLSVPPPFTNHWDEKDIVVITYGDSIITKDDKPLKTLHKFLNIYAKNTINKVHILPFFPYSSDDGFSIIDYSSVNDGLGSWDDIRNLAEHYGLMFDLVINHCSSRSMWFENFVQQEGIGKDFFFTAYPEDDLKAVVRPRTSPLLRETHTKDDIKHVWCTFSHDQVDFDFRNPDVLITFASIIRQYIDNGAKLFRLDAVAFLWKIVGSPSINLPQTHEVVRLLRTLIEHVDPSIIIITETNIPNRENLTYFGNANEAHAIYNFSLPPLLVNTMITGNSKHLKSWLRTMPPAQNGTTYFNFIASHDGIGLRPAEGLLDDTELEDLVSTMTQFGGKVSWRTSNLGEKKPYELNIALFDAMSGTVKGPDKWQIERFICAHAIMLGLEGIPGIYVHSLVATGNDYQRLANTGHNRSINRKRWDFDELAGRLDTPYSNSHKVLTRLSQLIRIRKAQPAFHPNATQFTLQLDDHLFGYWRQSMDRQQSIFCISNISDCQQTMNLSDVNLIITDEWLDLITQQPVHPDHNTILLQPYQTLWLSNRNNPVS